MHANLYQMPYAFVAGLLLSYSAIKTGSLAVPILLHAANNALALLLFYWPSALLPVVISLLLLCAVCAFLLFVRRARVGFAPVYARIDGFDGECSVRRTILSLRDILLSPIGIYAVAVFIYLIL